MMSVKRDTGYTSYSSFFTKIDTLIHSQNFTIRISYGEFAIFI